MKNKIKIIPVLVLVFALMIFSEAFAQANRVFDLEGIAHGHEKLSTITSSTAFTATYTAHSTYGNPFAALITIETAAIRFTIDGTTPVVTGATQAGHLMNAGDSYVIRGADNVKAFRCINAVASNGADVMVTYFY